ncbi:MarR family winged helix-turn-helix transcriptional regulator [Microbacterium gorillae]|uniref:MarR family winged helix-turn-helix transcriptional regulator n=1 Tax=Microbacterium gorillae TaxID=1231063 RepID=UPI000B31A3DF|nr:MarR family transcriptional regulator [Microbacterium gorillae]
MDDVLRPLGMTVSQYACLEVLQLRGAQSSAELARSSFVSRQSVNVMLKTMGRNGWVEVSSEPVGGRAKPYLITPHGVGDLVSARAAVLAVEERMVARMSQRDRATLLRLLSDCLGGLE